MSGAEHKDVMLQLAHARSIQQQAAQQAQQTATPQPTTSSNRRTSFTDTLRGLTKRGSGPGAAAGRGGGAGGHDEGEAEGSTAAAAATPVPEKATKSVAAHDGGCFTCAFDRSALAEMVIIHVCRVTLFFAVFPQHKANGIPFGCTA